MSVERIRADGAWWTITFNCHGLKPSLPCSGDVVFELLSFLLGDGGRVREALFWGAFMTAVSDAAVDLQAGDFEIVEGPFFRAVISGGDVMG